MENEFLADRSDCLITAIEHGVHCKGDSFAGRLKKMLGGLGTRELYREQGGSECERQVKMGTIGFDKCSAGLSRELAPICCEASEGAMSILRVSGHILAGVYSWILGVYLGAVLLDVVYSRMLRRVDDFLANSSVYSEAADFLLILGALTVFVGLATIVVFWDVKTARKLYLASVLLISLEFVAPIVLLPIIGSSPSSSILDLLGPFIRLAPIAVASLLAFAAASDPSRQRGGTTYQ